jgi:hypothetical protein
MAIAASVAVTAAILALQALLLHNASAAWNTNSSVIEGQAASPVEQAALHSYDRRG